jgi:hypothetical protein
LILLITMVIYIQPSILICKNHGHGLGRYEKGAFPYA